MLFPESLTAPSWTPSCRTSTSTTSSIQRVKSEFLILIVVGTTLFSRYFLRSSPVKTDSVYSSPLMLVNPADPDTVESPESEFWAFRILDLRCLAELFLGSPKKLIFPGKCCPMASRERRRPSSALLWSPWRASLAPRSSCSTTTIESPQSEF